MTKEKSMQYIALYNPYAANGKGIEGAERLRLFYAEKDLSFVSMTAVDYPTFFKELGEDERVIVCGGDGTLNRFVNEAKGLYEGKAIYYYACGSGNDFLRDLGKEAGCEPFCINEYIRDLPTVTVKGQEYRFINGVGYGIDGYCCEEGDRIREKKPGKKINYTGIAIKGLLFKYKPTNATVIVDGKEYAFKKVWLAPTMHGRYYGGGMMPTPAQDRLGEKKSSVMVFHGSGKLKTLMIFPSIFKGEHIKKTKCVTVLEGKEITVKFDAPRAVQVDGETILGVTEYTVRND